MLVPGPLLLLLLVVATLLIVVACTAREGCGRSSCGAARPWDSLALRGLLPATPPKRVAIVTLETRRSLRRLVELHNRSCALYAAQHGYEYRFLEDYAHPTVAMPVYWQKMQVVADVMAEPHFDYVMWLDSDALVARPEIPLEVLFALAPEAAVFIGKDWPRGERDAYCAGAFVVRNDAVGKRVLADCFDVILRRRACRSEATGALALHGRWAGECYEQGVLNELLKGRYKHCCYHAPEEFFCNGPCANFSSVIAHLYGDKAVAERAFEDFFRSFVPRLPFRENPSPPSAAVLLTLYVTAQRAPAYEQAAARWLRETPFDVFAVDSAGVGLALDHPRFRGCLTFRQAEGFQRREKSAQEKDAVLRALRRFEAEWRSYDLVFKATGKYAVPDLAAAVKHLPSDVDLVLQHLTCCHGQNSELFGARPSLLPRLLDAVGERVPMEAALARTARDNPDRLRICRLLPLPLEGAPRRGDGSRLACL